MNELQVKEVQSISSREVAEMMEVQHKNLISKIEKHTKILEKVNELNFKLVDLWQLSSYKDAKGETRKEYQVTKKGCEFLAHKTTGEKGDIFTIRYMDRFEEMKNIINSNEQLKAKLLLDIYNGGQEGIVASKQLVELEKQPLLETIEIQKPKVNYFDTFMNSQGCYTSTQVAKLFKLSSARKLNTILNENKIIYKQGNNWLPYSTTNKEWFKVTIGEKNTHNYSQLKFTPKGIYELSKLLNITLDEEDLQEMTNDD